MGRDDRYYWRVTESFFRGFGIAAFLACSVCVTAQYGGSGTREEYPIMLAGGVSLLVGCFSLFAAELVVLRRAVERLEREDDPLYEEIPEIAASDE